jgi:transcriptional regulator with GAF, ATPase, and Fis domain
VAAPEAAPAGKAGTLVENERRQIVETLDQTRWVVEGPRGAAKILGLHPNTLRSRMKKLGIRRSHDIS